MKGKNMTRRAVFVCGLAVALVLALGVASCQKKAPNVPKPNVKDFRAQFEQVTPGMDVDTLMKTMEGGMLESFNRDRKISMFILLSEEKILRATFTMEVGKVVSKDLQVSDIPRPPE